MKQSTKSGSRILMTLLFSIIFTNNLFSQVNYTEIFTPATFPPPGWSLNPAGNPIWSQQTTGTNPTCAPHSAGGMARFNSDVAPTGTNQALVLPIINYTNRAGVATSISFWIYRNQTGGGPGGGADSLAVLINTSNSVTGATRLGAVARSITINLPNTVTASGWYQYSFSVPTSFTGPVNYVLLMGYSRNGNNIFIDDVQWTDFPVQCNGTPSAGTLSSNPALICGGSGDAQISAIGGSIGYAGISYQWQQYDSTAGSWMNVGTNNFVLSTGTLNASTYYRLYISCDSSSQSDTSAAFLMNVSSSPLPVITTTPDSVSRCGAGAPVLLVASGAVNYTWSPASGLNTTTGDSVYASPAGTITYTVSGTDSIGCSGNATAVVQILNTPNLNATTFNDSICSGANASINVIGAGFGSSYVWNPGGMTGNNITVNPTATTTYTVVGTNNAGCTGTDSVTIYVLPATVAYFGYTINGYTVHFIDSSSNANSYTWYFGDGNLSMSQSPTYTYSGDGWYNVQLIVTNGVCAGDTFSVILGIGAVGINELNNNHDGLLIYPSPFLNKITIEFRTGQRETEIVLMNSIGKVSQKLKVNSSNGLVKQQMDMSDLASGVYFISINNNTQSLIRRIVKQ